MDTIGKELLTWYDRDRRILPWRETVTPYRTWISEVMLQQTRVDTVLPYFDRFMSRFPTVESLAVASLDEVLSLWAGLGYYSRARNMHEAAKNIVERGAFPQTLADLRSLPGVGEYMAAAIASIALGLDEATVDGNIARVMARIHADDGARKDMWVHAREHLPPGRAGDYNQALMDLGATICTPRQPRCDVCPIQSRCGAFAADTTALYPPPKKKRVVPEVACVVGVWRRSDAVLLGRRPAKGLWGGLYEPPTFDLPDGQDPKAWLKASLESQISIKVKRIQHLKAFRHVLTHRIVNADVFMLSCEGEPSSGPYTGCAWIEDLGTVGISSLTRQILDTPTG